MYTALRKVGNFRLLNPSLANFGRGFDSPRGHFFFLFFQCGCLQDLILGKVNISIEYYLCCLQVQQD